MLALVIVMGLVVPIKAHAGEISVIIDGVPVDFDGQKPMVVNGNLLVPVRGVFEHLGFDVSWEQATQTVNMIRADDVFIITIGERDSYGPVNSHGSSRIPQLVPAQIIDGRTMVRIDAFVNRLGLATEWNNVERVMTITTLPSWGGSEFVGLWRAAFWTVYDDDGVASIWDIDESGTRYKEFLVNGVMINLDINRQEIGRDGRREFAWTGQVLDDMLILQPRDSNSTWHFERVN